MEMIFCPNCQKLTGYKRAIGFGTFFAVVLTAGLWLLALPFYPKRCIVCGLAKSESVPWYRTWRVVVFPLLLYVGIVVVVEASRDQQTHRPPIVKGPAYNEIAEPGATAAQVSNETAPEGQGGRVEPPPATEEPPSFDDAKTECFLLIRSHFPKLVLWPENELSSRNQYQQDNKRLLLFLRFDIPNVSSIDGNGEAVCNVLGSKVRLASIQLGIFHYDFNDDGSVAAKKASQG